MLSEYYNTQFYSGQIDGSVRSAEVILPLLYKLYQPLSVIDIGCGLGDWLATAESLGSLKLRGLDGNWVKKEQLLSKNIDFTSVDFQKTVEIEEKYDLCISVEVAEHLPATHAQIFVDTLCKCSDVVLFSAAIKEQGGTNHINEQWQSYWISLFDSNDYDCLDIFRQGIWKNEEVEWWYRQNIFLFVLRTSDLSNLKNSTSMAAPIADIVHPENYENKIKAYKQMIQYPTLLFCLKCIKRYLAVKMKRLMGQAA
jgi:SAM-dependent methyltransferase